jgi:hypothetical protein
MDYGRFDDEAEKMVANNSEHFVNWTVIEKIMNYTKH